MKRLLLFVVLLALAAWAQTTPSTAYRFAQPGYPEMVLVWYTLTPNTMTVLTVANEDDEKLRQYVFHPPDARPTWGSLTYSIVVVPEGFGVVKVKVEQYKLMSSEEVEVQ